MHIPIPDNFISLVGSNSTTFFSDLAPVASLVFGILLAFMVIEMIVDALHKKKDDVE